MDSPPGLLSERVRGSSCSEGFTLDMTALLLGHVLFLPEFYSDLKYCSSTLPLDTPLLNTQFTPYPLCQAILANERSYISTLNFTMYTICNHSLVQDMLF